MVGIVEVYETYIGGKERSKHESKKLNTSRGPVGKVAVVGARERGGKVAAKPVQRTDSATLMPFAEERTKLGPTVHTDESRVYASLPNRVNRHRHEVVARSSGKYVCGEAHTNSIEPVWAALKRSIAGTWHRVGPKHLGRYVTEAAFRLNEENSGNNTIDRVAVLAHGDLRRHQLSIGG